MPNKLDVHNDLWKYSPVSVKDVKKPKRNDKTDKNTIVMEHGKIKLDKINRRYYV
jgi:hypothetical protein